MMPTKKEMNNLYLYMQSLDSQMDWIKTNRPQDYFRINTFFSTLTSGTKYYLNIIKKFFKENPRKPYQDDKLQYPYPHFEKTRQYAMEYERGEFKILLAKFKTMEDYIKKMPQEHYHYKLLLAINELVRNLNALPELRKGLTLYFMQGEFSPYQKVEVEV